MFFLVERVTPGQLRDHAGMGVSRALRAALPFEVEVTDLERRVDFESTCKCQSVFRLTDASVRALLKRGMIRQALANERNPCVCLCMGRRTEGR